VLTSFTSVRVHDVDAMHVVRKINDVLFACNVEDT